MLTCIVFSLQQTHLPNIKVHAYFAPVTPPPSVGGSRQRFCRCCVLLWCKDNDLPPNVLCTLSTACNLTPNLLWPLWAPLSQSARWCSAPFGAAKRGRRRTRNIPQNIPTSLHHSNNTCTAGFNRRSFAEVYAETDAECQHIPAPCLWTHRHYRRGSVQLGQIYKLNDYTTEKDQPYTITQDRCCQQNKSLNINLKKKKKKSSNLWHKFPILKLTLPLPPDRNCTWVRPLLCKLFVPNSDAQCPYAPSTLHMKPQKPNFVLFVFFLF